MTTTKQTDWVPVLALATALDGCVSESTLLRRIKDGTIKTAKKWGPKKWMMSRGEFEQIKRDGLRYYSDKKTAPK